MLCTFCGTENRPEYKFCGMCGVRLERREAERRTTQSRVSTKCASCGHLNEPGLKFCGMCGSRTERRIQERRGSEGDVARATATANAQLPTPEASGRRKADTVLPSASHPDLPPVSRRGEPAIFRAGPPTDGSHISGPSFLGLNSQPEGEGEYLLEDEPSGSGLRKFVLLVIIAAILGLIFVQWRSSFKASPKPPPAKAEPSTPQGSNQPAAPGSADQTSKDAATAGSANDSSTSANDIKSQAEAPIASPVPSSSAASSEPSPDTADKKPPESDGKPGATDAKATEEARLTDYKPSAALVRAQQYLQGRGVQQNCEQGLLYLRAAAEKNDPGAAIQMAALYSSGHCVKQDRVMAYRWFNSAHELEPANMWIQKNMDQLWAQMSSQERRLAGY
jgi:hypothetical protein